MYLPMWRCQDGRVMKITEMTDSHLTNAINMIYRGKDACGRRVGNKTKRLLPALELVRNIRSMGAGHFL